MEKYQYGNKDTDKCMEEENVDEWENLGKKFKVYQLVQKFIKENDITDIDELIYVTESRNKNIVFDFLEQLVETVGYTQDKTEVEE